MKFNENHTYHADLSKDVRNATDIWGMVDDDVFPIRLECAFFVVGCLRVSFSRHMFTFSCNNEECVAVKRFSFVSN